MVKLNLNFKPSIWQQRKWIPVLLSKEFNEIHYDYILSNQKENNILNRKFEISWNKYEELKSKQELPEWNTLRDCLLLFKVTDYTTEFAKTEIIGMQKYLFFKKIFRTPSRHYFSHIVDFKSENNSYRATLKIYTYEKYSKTIKTIIRNNITNYLKTEVSNLFLTILNGDFAKNLEIFVSKVYEIKKIELEKIKRID